MKVVVLQRLKANMSQRDSRVLPLGLEPRTSISKKTTSFDSGGAESGALGASAAHMDPELVAVAEAWESLPHVVKARIVTMVRQYR